MSRVSCFAGCPARGRGSEMEVHASVAAWLTSLHTLPREGYSACKGGNVKLDAAHTARFESGLVRACRWLYLSGSIRTWRRAGAH